MLQTTLQTMREEVLRDVARIAGRLGELRLDTEVDVSHGVVRYLELLKLAALAERPEEEAAPAALEDVNARLKTAMTPLQREIYESSPLDELLRGGPLGGWPAQRTRARAGGRGAGDGGAGRADARGVPAAQGGGPRVVGLGRGDVPPLPAEVQVRAGAQDPDRADTEPTLRDRGAPGPGTLSRGRGGAGGRGDTGRSQELLDLLDTAWRRAGLGDRPGERELREKARGALTRYHERLREEPAQPLWFERSFAFDLGPHHVRGRVDRVDQLPAGGYELIDYKTGYPKTPEELGEDIQLSLYAIAAREAWGLEDTREAYYYVLDDRKVPVPRKGEEDAEWVRGAVLEAGAGIMAQNFEPTPSPAVCALCDYRIVCPAAER